MAKNRIETLIERGDWKTAQGVIEKQLQKKTNDHWLWSRLSAVKYELRDYRDALDAAQKALTIVPDCPLALWSYANAAEMVGETYGAFILYRKLARRGVQQLREPDADANECWEGPDWTAGLIADCVFRAALCMEKNKRGDLAAEGYREYLSLIEADSRIPSIYSREDAIEKLKELMPNESDRREAAMKRLVGTKLFRAAIK
ncbi:MAG TPA: hypothetical protein VK395_33825 [Gemmataceae bacterium]|nr:hypothetical protein [Gemmataceae bacterium]